MLEHVLNTALNIKNEGRLRCLLDISVRLQFQLNTNDVAQVIIQSIRIDLM